MNNLIETSNKKNQFIWLLVLSASFIFCFWQTIVGLYNIWSHDEDYSYAFLIPFIMAYLIWERRKEIAQAPISTNILGGASLLVFLLISAYGILGSSPSAVRPAIPFIILSITLFCFGNSLFKILVFPLSMLFFMIPLPTVVQTWIGLPLKSISTKLGAFVLHVFGIHAFVEGNVIDLGVTQLQVVDACSGLRYILPLFALGVIFAYFFEKVRWKQIVLVALTIPISIITNGMRIGMTGILAQHYGAGAAEGFFHAFSGWLIFIIAFVMLFAFHYLMKIIFKEHTAIEAVSDSVIETNPSASSKNNQIPVFVSCALLIVVGLLSLSTAALPRMILKEGFAKFPLEIGNWKGQTELMDREMTRLSGAEEAFTATYTNVDGSSISLYVGYRGSPFLESENFFHSPNVCIPSSGWKVLYIKKHKISAIPNIGDVTIQKMLIEKMGRRDLVYYWFQTKNRISHDVNINRFHLTLHALSRDNTYDLFIRPITPLQPNESVEDAEKRMDQFVREMMTELLKFLKERQIKGKA